VLVVIINITHDDLDGFLSAYLVKHAFEGEKFKYISSSVHDVDNNVKKYIIEEHDPNNLYFITDLSVSNEVADLLDAYNNVTLLDHHITASHLKDRKWAYLDLQGKVSASELTYRYLINKATTPEYENKYKEVAKIATDYDLWIKKIPKSDALNNLLYATSFKRLFDNSDKYFKICRNGNNYNLNFTNIGRHVIMLYEESKDAYISSAISRTKIVTIKNMKVGLVFAENHISQLGNEIIDKLDADIVCILNAKNQAVSFRSKKDIDVSKLAQALGGGGHKNASGCGFSFAPIVDTLIKEIENKF
jgi:oligoribonuclease NrnB/cAMP/cGMP phosphodiesterase (DHH superfamily)